MSGHEIATSPISVFVEHFAKFCQVGEASGRLPNAGQTARQTHLPGRAHDNAQNFLGSGHSISRLL